MNLDEIGVPLVILSPGAPAGRVVRSPVSLRDLPATVVDRLGLSAGSPFPGRSLAAYWGLPPGPDARGAHHPGLLGAGQTRPRSSLGPALGHAPGFQMSIVASDHHYIRDGAGDERLYDLRNDPFEQVDLMKSADGKRERGGLPQDAPRSAEREPRLGRGGTGLLESYRRSLKALVDAASAATRSSPIRLRRYRTGQPRRPAS